MTNIFETAFDSPEICLDFYRRALNERCPDDEMEDEIGPVFQQKRDNLAELYLKGTFCIGDSCVEMQNGMDWYAAPHGDLEWTCTLARNHHILALAKAYRQTREEAYAHKALSQIISWVDNVKKPDLPEEAFHKFLGDEYLLIKRSNWRPLETAFRIGETWPLSLKHLVSSRAMTPEIWCKILRSIHEQAEYLNIYRWQSGNHAVMEAAMISICAIIFHELRHSKQWLENAVTFLKKYLDHMFFEDGYSQEISGGYNWVAKKGYVALFETALQNRIADALFPSAFTACLFKIFKSELYHLKPDFSVPVTNESNYTATRQCQLRKINKILNDPEIDFVLSRGKRGIKPAFDSYFYRDAGLSIMRSGWAADSLYLFFDAGKKGGHVIGDQLSVEVSAYGTPLLANSGRWRYTTSNADVGWMDWAVYFKTSASCNTVMPEGYTQIPEDVQFVECTITSDSDYTKGVFKGGYTKEGAQILRLIHHRQVYFAKPCFWIVRDTIEGNERARIEQHWHFLPDLFVEKHPGYIEAKGDGTVMIILQADTTAVDLYKGDERLKRGWMCPEYASKLPAYEAVFAKSKDTGPCVFETLIFPHRGELTKQPIFKSNNGVFEVLFQSKSWHIMLPGSS